MPKFIPRDRKQKARVRSTKEKSVADSNQAEILPVTKFEKEERRARLKEDLQAHQIPSQASSKKRKRLNKYIDLKLKRQENVELLKKLSGQTFDTSLLRSSKRLGRGSDTRRETLLQALREKHAGIESVNNDAILFETRETTEDPIPLEENDSESSVPQTEAQKEPALFGTGLKRPLEVDEDGNPIVKARKRLKFVKKRLAMLGTIKDDWEGFSSESDSSKLKSMQGSAVVQNRGDLGSNDTNIASQSEEDEPHGSDSDEGGSEESDSGEHSDSSCSVDTEDQHERSSAFKAWAAQQRNAAIGFEPSRVVDLQEIHNRASTTGQSVDHATLKTQNRVLIKPLSPAIRPTAHKIFHIDVARSDDVKEERLKLPVVAEEQKIMEALRENDCIIIWGATGSGKTTQVPQFLFEAGYGDPKGPCPGIIGVTQPRRVAAVSMARRVATELGNIEGKVSHQVRFDSSVSKKTAIKFMTDGVLLREMSQDFALKKYSVIIIDEAHERSINTDLLIGMLSRAIVLRAEFAVKQPGNYKPLKLILMSATMRISDFAENRNLFRQHVPPVVQAEGRQHAVTMHFARRTSREYLEDMYSKISKGHKRLPPGGMLVFLTGQSEIMQLAKRLQEDLPSTSKVSFDLQRVSLISNEVSYEEEDMDFTSHGNVSGSDSESDTEFHGFDNQDEEEDEFNVGDEATEMLKVHVLPLYSQLRTAQQMRIFQPPPDGSRMIVLATNVAETSLTIPNIRYVFDCGRAKQKQYNQVTGVQTFNVDWISKASADQRAGRAGRTGPGHCYRLYSSAVFERDFEEFSEPEILRTPVEGIVLQLKGMGITNVTNFPFPTPPNETSLLKAERLLEALGAVSNGILTQIGRDISAYPLSPRLSRIIEAAMPLGCIDHAIALVAILAVPDVLVSENQLDIRASPITDGDTLVAETDNREAAVAERLRKRYNTFHAHVARSDRYSDAIKLLVTLCHYISSTEMNELKYFARTKALDEAKQLYNQLRAIVNSYRPASVTPTFSDGLKPPSSVQIKQLRYAVAAGHIDQIALRADLSPIPPETSKKPRRATDVPYITLNTSSEAIGYAESIESTNRTLVKYCYIHGSSVLAHISVEKLPQFLVYSHLSQAAPSTIVTTATDYRVPRTRLHPLAPIASAQIIALASGTPLLEEGKPIGKIESLPRSESGEERRACWTIPFLKGSASEVGWPLPPARKVVQRRVRARGWVIESSSDKTDVS